MIRIIKTISKQHAEEMLERLKDAHKAGKGRPVLRQFEDGAGQKYYEVWIDYNRI